MERHRYTERLSLTLDVHANLHSISTRRLGKKPFAATDLFPRMFWFLSLAPRCSWAARPGRGTRHSGTLNPSLYVAGRCPP